MFYRTLEKLCQSKNTTVTALLKNELILSTSKGTAWKNGSVPNGEILCKIADYFNVSTDYLLGREKAPAMQGLSEDERQLLTSFRGASPEGQRSILRVAKNECRGLDIDESHARIEEMLSGHNQDFQEEDA